MYRFADSLQAGSGCSILILLASCLQTCVTYTIAVCTVKNARWWTEELSKTCRISFQEEIWEINASSWFYYKKFIVMHSHMNVKFVLHIICSHNLAVLKEWLETTCILHKIYVNLYFLITMWSVFYTFFMFLQFQ